MQRGLRQQTVVQCLYPRPCPVLPQWKPLPLQAAAHVTAAKQPAAQQAWVQARPARSRTASRQLAVDMRTSLIGTYRAVT